MVWVSHKHADHMLGLSGILAARSASQLPLLVRMRNSPPCSILVMQPLLPRSKHGVCM